MTINQCIPHTEILRGESGNHCSTLRISILELEYLMKTVRVFYYQMFPPEDDNWKANSQFLFWGPYRSQAPCLCARIDPLYRIGSWAFTRVIVPNSRSVCLHNLNIKALWSLKNSIVILKKKPYQWLASLALSFNHHMVYFTFAWEFLFYWIGFSCNRVLL